MGNMIDVVEGAGGDPDGLERGGGLLDCRGGLWRFPGCT